MWHKWQEKQTTKRHVMTEDDAKHEARRLTERTGRIHIPVYTCDGWAVQRVETVVYTEQAN